MLFSWLFVEGRSLMRRSELYSVMGPTHLMALSAEGLKYCVGGSLVRCSLPPAQYLRPSADRAIKWVTRGS